jgi:hypothetical protein
MKTSIVGLALAAASVLVAACQFDTGASEKVESTSAAVVGTDSFLYFRCSATGWGVDDATRLEPLPAIGMFRLTYRVTQPWMVSGFDTCTLTETNQRNGWGTSQTFYDKRGDQLLVVPQTGSGSGQLSTQVTGPDYHFQVKYPQTGTYTFTANWLNGSFAIERQATALIDNLAPNETVPHELVVVDGSVPGTQSTVDITSGGAMQTVNVSNGRYKGLVRLAPGANTIRVAAAGLQPNEISVNYQPSTNDHLVRMVYVVAKNDAGTFQVGPWTRSSGDDPSKPLGANDLATAVRKLKFAGLMIQTAYAEMAWRAGLGRRTFRLDRDAGGEVAVQILTLPQTREELWNTYYADPADEQQPDPNPNAIRRSAFYDLIASQLPQEPFKHLAFTSMSRYDSTTGWEYTAATLGMGNLGLQAAIPLSTFPESVDQVVIKFNDPRLVSAFGMPNLGMGDPPLWQVFTTDMGGAAHELGHGFFGFDHSDVPCSIMSRGFDWFVRLFVSSGAGGSTWPRSDEMCLDAASAARLDQSLWFR